jgi:hypothetical protein
VRQVQKQRQLWQRRTAGAALTVTGLAASAYIAVAVAQPAQSGYPFWSAERLGRAEKAELPHLPEVGGTSYSIYTGPGTARADIATGPVDPWADLVGRWRYGVPGPTIWD